MHLPRRILGHNDSIKITCCISGYTCQCGNVHVHRNILDVFSNAGNLLVVDGGGDRPLIVAVTAAAVLNHCACDRAGALTCRSTAVAAAVAASLTHSPPGGTCWSAMARNGRCTEVLYEKSSKEDCCASHSITTAWSEIEYNSPESFFYRVLDGGAPCTACKNSCDQIECGIDKMCVMKKGQAKCVCSSKCKESKYRFNKGPVCGTDGRSYRNVCRLRKRACRKRSTTLIVAYSGLCQSSCDRINCPSGKHCLLDQNLTPHCVNCLTQCSPNPKHPVCGADGNTYPSACHLREQTCKKGKAIPIAYKGPCRDGANCSTVRCRDRQLCLTDLTTGYPRCVSCSMTCRPRHMHGPICGTNNNTYHSWCHMMLDACAKGYIIETKHAGKCTTTIFTQNKTVKIERN